MLGRLRLCLYGTRDAALNWQSTLSEHLVEIGFIQGIGHPSVFRHATRDVWTLVHGDDCCSAGKSNDLDWFHKALGEKFDIKTQRLGRGKDKDGKPKLEEGQVLNRVIRRTRAGWELEADPRHAEIIIQHLDLQDANSVSTPGVDLPVANPDEIEEEEELSPADSTKFRAIGARCNYLQPDRPDIQYATKEVCRMMSKPNNKSWEMLKRIGRYLKGRPRRVWKYKWPSPQDIVEIHSDTNWAGCRESRK